MSNNGKENAPDRNDSHDLGDDLEITQMTRRAAGAGTWVDGTLNGCQFNALVFPDHATNRAWEIGDSKISKLWLQRLEDRTSVYNWDRGPDIPAQNAEVLQVVDFLCTGLADYVYGGSSSEGN